MAESVAKYQRYDEYKASGVEWLDVIPSHWVMSKIKYISPFQVGWTPSTGNDSNFIGENIWANISDLRGKVITDTVKRISDKAAKEASMDITPKGSLLYSFKLSVGSVSFAGRDMYTNEAIASFTSDSLLPLEYLYYVLPKFLIKNASTNIYGARILNQELIKNAIILKPTYEEAETIAKFLDFQTAQIDTLVDKQQTLIQLLKEKRQAVISHAVTKGLNPDAPMKGSGVEWLGEVPEHWEVSFVKHVVSEQKNAMVDGPFGSSVNTSEDYVDEGIPVIRTVNITNNGFSSDSLKFMRKQKFEQLKRHSVKPNDVLFSKVGTIGNACLLPSDIPEAILSTTGSCKISVDKDKIEGEYLVLMFHLMNQTLMEMANSNVQPFLNMSNIKNLKISLPSIEEQKNILTYLEEKLVGIDDLIAKSLSFDKLIRERRTALISAAVTGKIDVRDWVAPDSKSS